MPPRSLRLCADAIVTVSAKKGLPAGSITNGVLKMKVVLAGGCLLLAGGGLFESINTTGFDEALTPLGPVRVAEEKSDGLLNVMVMLFIVCVKGRLLTSAKTPSGNV
jgi:hypothetical protein